MGVILFFKIMSDEQEMDSLHEARLVWEHNRAAINIPPMIDLNPSANELKIVFIGKSGVGKTALVTQFVEPDKFLELPAPPYHVQTLGVSVAEAEIKCPVTKRDFRLGLWDTGGNTKWRTYIPHYLRNAWIVFVVVDLTDRDSFIDVDEWVHLARVHAHRDAIVLLIANKSDLKKHIEVGYSEIVEKGRLNGCTVVQTCAKNHQDVQKMFFAALEHLPNPLPDSDAEEDGILSLEPDVEKGQRNGCFC